MIHTIRFGSAGDPTLHYPAYTFSPQDDISSKEAALCSMAVSRMENAVNRDYTDMLTELGIMRHFKRTERYV